MCPYKIPIVVVDKCITMNESLIPEETDAVGFDSLFIQPIERITLVRVIFLIGDDNDIGSLLKAFDIIKGMVICGSVKEYLFGSKIEEIPATCLTDGVSEYWTCRVCGKKFSDDDATTEIRTTGIGRPITSILTVSTRLETSPTSTSEP